MSRCRLGMWKEIKEIITMQEENDNILICMNGNMDLAAVIKEAAGIAQQHQAALTAIYVDTREHSAGGRETETAKRLALAEHYHARIVTVYGENAADQIVQYARAGGITKIVAGYPDNGGIGQWRDFQLAKELAKKGKGIELILVSAAPDTERAKKAVSNGYRKAAAWKKIRKAFNWKEVASALLILALFTAAGMVLSLLKVGETNIIIMYMISILVIAIRCAGRGYAIVSSILVVLLFNFLFTEPKYTLKAYGAQYPLTFLFMFTASIIISAITLKVKQQAKASAVNAYRTEVLLETSRQLQAAKGWDDIIEKSARQLIKLLKTTVIVFQAENGSLGEEKVYTAGEFNCGAIYVDQDEKNAAAWTLKNQEPAGASTRMHPEAAGYYLPVRNGQETACVFGVVLDEKNRIEPLEKSLLTGMIDEISLAIEKYSLDEKSKNAQMEAEKEHLRADLLRAISHDLRTPLTSISGNASILLGGHAPDAEAGKKLLKDIEENSRWLIQLVENLLAITKLDNGGLVLHKEPELLEDIILEAVKHVYNPNEDHTIAIGYQEELLMADAEAALVIQVVVNIINNAVKYTPPGSRIQIKSFSKGDRAVVEISDDGNGISDKDKEHVFEMFYTADKNSGDGRRGLGLGLALCKSIVHAHDGDIYVKDNKPKGAVFGFTLKKVSTDGSNA